MHKQTKMQQTATCIAAALCLSSAILTPQQSAAAEQTGYLPLNRDGAVYSDNQSSAYASCNAVYYDAWTGNIGSYLAYDLSACPAAQRQTVNLAWYSGAWGNYDYTVLNESAPASLSEYKIYINDAPGGAYPEDGWTEIAAITGNTTHSRQHIVEMDGSNWIKLEVLGIQNGGNTVNLNVDIHECTNGLADSWMFFGDSITAGGMTTFSSGDGNFADLLHALDARFYPAQENGGIGGIFSTTGRENIDRWLEIFPGQYVSIAYGTNDCWGNQTGAEKYYENTVYMIEAIQAAGKTAVLPKISFSLESGVAAYIDDYNAMVDRIYEEYPSVIQGPDFYTYFEENPDGLSGDGVHPNEQGYNAMRRLWAETMYEAVYQNRAESTPPTAGDINGNGTVEIADLVLLRKFLMTAGPLTAAQATAADLDQNGIVNAADLSLLKALLLTA